MKKNILLIFLFAFNVGFSQNIVIKYIGNSNDKILLSYPVMGSNYEVISLSKENRFVNIKANANVIVSSCDAKRATKIFAEANDTIEFYLDKKGLINYSCKNNPKRKSESEYINASYLKYGAIETARDKRSWNLIAKKDGQNTYIDEDYVKEIEFLEFSCKNTTVSASFYKWFKAMYWSLVVNNKLHKTPIKEETFSVIEKSFDNAGQLMTIVEYRNLLSDYLTVLIKKEGLSDDLLMTMKFITTKFSNQTIVDYLLFSQIKKSQIKGSKSNRVEQNSLNFFRENCKNIAFLDEVDQDFSALEVFPMLSEIVKKT